MGHHCHGYADDLDGSTSYFAQSLTRRVPRAVNGHVNSSQPNRFIFYCKSTIHVNIVLFYIPKRLERIYGERQVI